MKQHLKTKPLRLVIFGEITKFVAKVFLMTTISDFKNGDIVCLTHDKTKRFVVENNLIFNGKILLSHFNEFTGVMAPAQMKQSIK